MKIDLGSNTKHLLVLGAGASKDYCLPTWNELGDLMREKLSGSEERKCKNEMLDWLDKLDKQKKYKTIDECITKESDSKEYRENGHDIEDEMFLVIKEILDEKYDDNENGWIEILNAKILEHTHLANKIAFINYNYDKVLCENFLVFKYLSQKAKETTCRRELEVLSDVKAMALFPHDYLFSGKEIMHPTFLDICSSTPKTDNGREINAVSCYDSDSHRITSMYDLGLKLYVLGLGSGLEYNLNKMELSISISEIHVTIKDASLKDGILNFLSERFDIPKEEIKVYSTCNELANSNFMA